MRSLCRQQQSRVNIQSSKRNDQEEKIENKTKQKRKDKSKSKMKISFKTSIVEYPTFQTLQVRFILFVFMMFFCV